MQTYSLSNQWKFSIPFLDPPGDPQHEDAADGQKEIDGSRRLGTDGLPKISLSSIRKKVGIYLNVIPDTKLTQDVSWTLT